MRTASLAAVAVAAMLLLSACSQPTASAPETAPPSPTVTPSPTPTIDPGPIQLSKDEAGQRYLRIVCQRNFAGAALSEAFAAQEDTFLNGGDADVSPAKAAAAEAMRVGRASVELLDDAYYVWPDGLEQHLKAIRDSNIAEASTLSSIANAARFEDAYYATWPADSTATAAQEIRYQLGLAADAIASCQGFETATDALHAEMVARNDYLALFLATDD